MIPQFVMSSFLSSDFVGTVRSKCDYCHRSVPLKRRDSLDIHVALAHMPPSEVSKELRRNMDLGHP